MHSCYQLKEIILLQILFAMNNSEISPLDYIRKR